MKGDDIERTLTHDLGYARILEICDGTSTKFE